MVLFRWILVLEEMGASGLDYTVYLYTVTLRRQWKVMEGHGRSRKALKYCVGPNKVMEGHGMSWKVMRPNKAMDGHGAK